MTARGARATVSGVLGDVDGAVRLALGRRDSAAVVAAVTVGYLLAYLWATGDLSLRTGVAPGVLVIDDPLGRLFARTGPASFGAIATVDTGVVRLLLSPVDVAIGAVVAGLVGINLGTTYLAVRRPAECGIGAVSGLLASVPALLSGTVCCGPVVLLAVGIQATAVVLTAFVWLLPIGIALLLASLAYVATKIDPGRPIEP
ncbi:hypothetical protein [Halorubrum sp. SP9]|uniref:hypothetical protein n=1 Tax=Halorubrum sp. SP9 TaxID=1537267 RepID=UPI0010F4E171|nr:hypothetical protein [Halorubrum sp. SP9]TKX66985.1 hypothetical protein EXE45_14625 [Halorubrum sp. SP9]